MKPRIYANRKRFVDGISGCLPKSVMNYLKSYGDNNLPVFFDEGIPCFATYAFMRSPSQIMQIEIEKRKERFSRAEIITLNIPLSAS